MNNFSQKKVKIFMSIVDSESRLSMEKWIGLAVKNRVEELDLSFLVEQHLLFGRWLVNDFPLPQTVYAAESLKALSLQFCPYTEDLILKLTDHWNLIHISRLKYLKSIEINYLKRDEWDSTWTERLEKVRIEASNQEKLHCYNITSLRDEIESSSSLRDLRLESVNIADQCLHDLIANSARIEILKLPTCNNLRKLKISSDSLREIEISSCKWLVETHIEALNLNNFFYSGKPLKTFRHTSPLCDAVMFLRRDFSVGKWIQFLSIPVQLKQLTLEVIWLQEGDIGLLDENSQRPLWRLENLVLGATAEASYNPVLVDSLIRWCIPKTVSILMCDQQERIS